MGSDQFWKWVSRLIFLILAVDILTRWYSKGIYE
jgi:hypothetical protein